MPFADVPGARLFHRLEGDPDKPVLLLSNSLGTTHAMWEPQMAALLRRFRVLRYDSRGHGQSSITLGPYDIVTLGRDALALIEGLGLGRVHVAGLSMGGMVAMWLAVNAPTRVDRLILANTSARIGAPEVWNARIETVRSKGMAAIIPGVIERWFTPSFRARDPATVDRIARMLHAAEPAGYVACCAAVRDVDLIDRLPGVESPTLVIAGTHDAATPPAHAERIAGSIKGARIVTLDAAHLSNVEQANAFTAAMLEVLPVAPSR
ncbi:MAG: 3-oxoadipate enol-lactonase [Alphaproteobacteria bacterium]|nr:3-oxoadipate enol-lactonase [Alphaproteobacteria bacterium]